LPFVFAVWAVRREALAAHPKEVAALTQALVAAREWGEQHRDAVIDAAVAAKPYHRALYDDYFTRLSYRLDERAEQGLERFSTLFMPKPFAPLTIASERFEGLVVSKEDDHVAR
jgi:chorismate dehydratase